MIKILTGYSGLGGSTTALINLTNTLNKVGYPTIFYGPDEYHKKICRYGRSIKDYQKQFGERLIIHFGDFKKRPEHAKRVIFSSYEKKEYEVNDQICFWDSCVFSNDEHKKYHSNYTGPYKIIPNLHQKIKNIEKSPEAKKCAGVIGNICERKQPHISIQRALDDGYEKVYLFGNLSDKFIPYFEKYVYPFIEKFPNQVIYCGPVDDKSKIYSMIDAAYLSSVEDGEVSPLVRDECKMTGTIFKGTDACNFGDDVIWTNKKILDAWIDILHLNK